MSYAIKIDDETISAQAFINFLKLSNHFYPLAQEFINVKIAAKEAKKKGIDVSDAELQEGADATRARLGLNKANDMQDWLQSTGISLDEFEIFIQEHLYMHKLIDSVVTDEKLEERFKSVPSKHAPIDSRYKLKAEIADELYREWIEKQLKNYKVLL